MTFKVEPIKFVILSYFHVRIIWDQSFLTYYAYEVNNSEEQTKDIANQFAKGEPLWFDGKRIDPKNIVELRVYETTYGRIQFSSSYWHNSFPNGDTGDFGGTDVTRRS